MSHAKQDLYNSKLANVSKVIFLGLLAYMPLHVLIATWAGSSVDQLEVAKAIKDPVMLGGLFLAIIADRKNLRAYFNSDKPLYVAIAAYGLLVCVSASVFSNNRNAEILGITYDLRFLCFFIYGLILANRYKTDIQRKSVNVALVVGVIVACLGIVQVLFLPNDALTHIGFSKATGSQPVFYIHDEIQATERASSSIKDPNSLGSYLLIILSLSLAFLYSTKTRKERWSMGLLLIAPLVLCLGLTYSRSAWLGLGVGLAFLVYYFLSINKRLVASLKKRIPIIIAGLVMFILLFVGFGISRTSLYRSVVLHDQLEQSVDSNTKRLDSYRESINLIKDNPVLGLGVGSAGPVSFKNAPNQAIVSENYYLQIAIELGLAGLMIFIGIVVYIAAQLYKTAQDSNLYALALVVSLLAISVASMFNHIWANEAVAYTWWGLAGLYVAGSAGRVQNT